MPNYLMRCLSFKVIIVYLVLMVAAGIRPEENPKPENVFVAKRNFLSRERDYLKAKPISNDLRTFIRRYKRRSVGNVRKVKREQDYLKEHVYVVRNGNIEKLENLSEVIADVPPADPSGLGNFTVIPLIIPIAVKTFTNSTFCDNFTYYSDDILSTKSVRKATDYNEDEINNSATQDQAETVDSTITFESSSISNTKTAMASSLIIAEAVSDDSIRTTTIGSNSTTAEVISDGSLSKTTIASSPTTAEVISDGSLSKTTIASSPTTAEVISDGSLSKTTIASSPTTAEVISDGSLSKTTISSNLTTGEVIRDDSINQTTISSNLSTGELTRDDSINKTTIASNFTTGEVIRGDSINKTTISSNITTAEGVTDDFISTTSRGMMYLNKVLTDVQELISYEKEGKSAGSHEGAMCTVVGDWDSKAGGMQLQITAKNELKHSPIVELVQQEPEAENGFLMTGNWNITSLLPFNHSSAIILTAISERTVASFLGDCRICEGTETITGNWMLMDKSANCKDRQNAHSFFSDVMRKSNIRKLHNKHLEEMSTKNLNVSTTTKL